MKFLVALVQEYSLPELAKSLKENGYKTIVVSDDEIAESGRRVILLVSLEDELSSAEIEGIIASADWEATTFTIEVEERAKSK